MPDLFQSTDIGHISFIHYAELFLNKNHGEFDCIQLPPIQRNSVWNVAQIERLWDSLFRGFPIGSFYLSERKQKTVARSVLDGIQREQPGNGYFLLDGQQRTRALLLGFKATGSARLYIDLDPQLPFHNPEDNDRKFIFRLLTNYQPWGMNKETPVRKLSDPEKQNARKVLAESNLHYDYQLKINHGTVLDEYQRLNGFSPWPIQSRLPVPVDILIEACGGYSGNFREADWNFIMEYVPEQYKSNRTTEPTSCFKDVLKSMRNLLSKDSVRQRHISLLLHTEEEVSQNTTKNIDPLEVLFTRVNANGTPLEGEEMAYSLLKSSWDEAYNLVSQILNNPEIGYLFTPTKLVMAASRIAALRAKKNDDPKPNVTKFRQWIAERSANDQSFFLDEMKRIMLPDDLQVSRFTRILSHFCQLAIFRENGPSGDSGLPRKLLLHLRASLIHPVLIWIDRQLDQEIDFEVSRKGIIRYLSYSLVGFDDPDKVSKAAVRVITSTNNTIFPDREIYLECLENDLAKVVPAPDQILSFGNAPADGYLRHWDALLGEETDPLRPFRLSFWWKKELLLWFQRSDIPVWFPGYNPMSEDASDTPYDYDHILPASHIFGQGSRNNLPGATPDHENAFKERRGRYLGSIGNYRIWPLWANRSDGNICPAEKLRMDMPDLSEDKVARQLKYTTEKDFTEASCINPDNRDSWFGCAGNPAKWPDNRRKAWQTAVEERIKYLYRIFYNTLQFENWRIGEPQQENKILLNIIENQSLN